MPYSFVSTPRGDKLRLEHFSDVGCYRSRAPITPWGKAQSITRFCPGFDIYSTSRHGGVRLSAKLNKNVPDVFKIKGGWYEEDCEAAIPFYFNWKIISDYCLEYGMPEGYKMPAEDYFLNHPKEQFKETLIKYMPAAWELYSGEEVAATESDTRDHIDAQKQLILEQIGRNTIVLKRGMKIKFVKKLSFRSRRESFSEDTFMMVDPKKKTFRLKGGEGDLVRIPKWKSYNFQIVV
jgi:hypothetical protein